MTLSCNTRVLSIISISCIIQYIYVHGERLFKIENEKNLLTLTNYFWSQLVIAVSDCILYVIKFEV